MQNIKQKLAVQCARNRVMLGDLYNLRHYAEIKYAARPKTRFVARVSMALISGLAVGALSRLPGTTAKVARVALRVGILRSLGA